MQPLATLALDSFRSLLPAGQDHTGAHQALIALLGECLGAEVTGFFAPVRTGERGISFFAPEGRVARFAELDAAGQDRLRAEIGRIISALRRAATLAAQENPAGAGHLPALVAAAMEIPSFDQVFAHEGRPVLAGWGTAPVNAPGGLGLLRSLDDGKPAEAPRRLPLAALGAALAALVLLGAVSALAAPWITRWLSPEPAMCRVEQGDLDAMDTMLRERGRERELRNRLASLEEELGRRRAACALPEPPAPLPPQPEPPPRPPAPEPPRPPEPQPTPAPEPPRAPPPAPSLPAERWDRGDLGLLKGCWVLGAETQGTLTTSRGRQELCRVSAGRICFGEDGRGTREEIVNCPSENFSCRAPVSASFEGGVLRLAKPRASCAGGAITWNAQTLNCRRVGNDLASCVDNLGTPYEFRRAGGTR